MAKWAELRQSIIAPMFYELKEIAMVLKNPIADHPELSINSLYWANYNFASITSCEVERAFCAYKLILDDKRDSLSIENLEKIMIVYCNSKYD